MPIFVVIYLLGVGPAVSFSYLFFFLLNCLDYYLFPHAFQYFLIPREYSILYYISKLHFRRIIILQHKC